MTFQLSEVTSDSDFDELIPLLWRAYTSPPPITFLPLLFPAEDDGPEAREKQIAQCKAAMKHLHQSDPSSHWLKVTETDTGRVVAGCRWHVFEKDPYSDAPERPFVVTSWPEGDRRKYATLCIGEIVLPRKARYRKPHLSLQVCFTDPDFRGRGIGRLLMEWGAKKADEMGVESFVEASEMGMHLNKKFGFVIVSEEQTDTNTPNPSEEWKDMVARFPPPVAYWMWRPIGGKFEEGKTIMPW